MFIVRQSSVKLKILSEVMYNNLSKAVCINNSVRSTSLLNESLKKTNTSFCKTFCTTANTELQSQREEADINFEVITNGDKELEHKLGVIRLEAEVMRQEGRPVPSDSYLSVENWNELLKLPSRTARTRYLEYLFKVSKKKENKLAKKIQKRVEREESRSHLQEDENKPKTIEDHALRYDLQHNNIFLRIYETTINQFYNNRLIQAMQFGQKVVIDCGYDANMTKRENINCAKQLMLMFSDNRNHDEPFDVHYCNANLQSDLMIYLEKHIPTMYEPWFPMNIHQCSYLDLFPKQQLVYLTPHCREELLEFDHDAVYIIGGIVDKVNNEPLSLAKAKREGLRMAKLPLDRYLQWGSGSGKSLTLNQCISVLLDVKSTGQWDYALRHVPKRKLIELNAEYDFKKIADRQRFEKPRRQTKWIPASNIDFRKLGFSNNNRKHSSEDEEKERIVTIKNILNE